MGDFQQAIIMHLIATVAGKFQGRKLCRPNWAMSSGFLDRSASWRNGFHLCLWPSLNF